ncbi:hypothetical protein [Paracoccus yeei]|uniref:hypothetical protein n=1 Tax=Paracoccus yeei TaxID=147645 RepID=UPI003BF83771
MTDPRKPVHLQGGEQADVVSSIVHAHLIECTSLGARALGCTGTSFVTMGMGIWATELAELDGKAAAQFLRALADLMEPGRKPAAKQEAEARRQYAVRRLLAAVDLMMNETEGRA